LTLLLPTLVTFFIWYAVRTRRPVSG
jgi:hypothetical protein